MSTRGCLDPDDLLAWVDGRLADAERAEALAHVAVCPACREAASALARVATLEDAPLDGPAPIAPGALLGRFRVTRVLGRGGMGVVVAALDQQLDREVAIKLARGGHVSRRLEREGRTLASLPRHPNLVTVLEAGCADDGPFVVMELIDGVSLRELMITEPPSWREALPICVDAGRGLAALHAAGLVHRDVKPDNVMIARDGRVVLVDLGLAKTSGDEPARGSEPPLTQTGAVVGTPRYLAPELISGQPASPRTDVYAFCAMTLEVLRAQRIDAVPPRLHAVLSRGLDPVPAARWGSVLEVLAALERGAVRGRMVGAALIGVAAVAVAAGGYVVATIDRSPPRSPGSVAGSPAPDAAPLAVDAQTIVPSAPIVAVADPAARPAPPRGAADPRVTASARLPTPSTIAATPRPTLSIDFLRELGRTPATARTGEARVWKERHDRGGCAGARDAPGIPLGIDWGRVERRGVVDVIADGRPVPSLLYQVAGQRGRYVFEAYSSWDYLDVAIGAQVLVCPTGESRRTAPAGWTGDFVTAIYGGPIAGEPPVLRRTPRPRYLPTGPFLVDGRWPHGDIVLFAVTAPPREVLGSGRRDMGIYFLDVDVGADLLDRASRASPAWVVARFAGYASKRDTEYPVLHVDEARSTLFEPR